MQLHGQHLADAGGDAERAVLDSYAAGMERQLIGAGSARAQLRAASIDHNHEVGADRGALNQEALGGLIAQRNRLGRRSAAESYRSEI